MEERAETKNGEPLKKFRPDGAVERQTTETEENMCNKVKDIVTRIAITRFVFLIRNSH
mgnify:FL=1